VSYERKDAHFRRAKAQGLRARSAFKLAELDDRHRLIARGDRLVDLGAWPGGWVQIAAERVGPTGRVVAIDLAKLDPFPRPNVTLLVGDVREAATVDVIEGALGGQADVVLSDMAPKLTGVRMTDEARSAELMAAVLAMLPRLLRPGGNVVVKLFMGPDYQDTLAAFRRAFADVKTTRPEASRRGSAELYLVGKGHHPPVDNL
jgi:23S rRNA (uridine2552-2'-O)-methyltransferase